MCMHMCRGGGACVIFLAPKHLLCGPVFFVKEENLSGEKMLIFPKLIYKLIAIPIKSPQEVFIKPDKLIWTSIHMKENTYKQS